MSFVLDNPSVGTFRHAHAIGIENLRSWRLKRFPFLLFYRVSGDALELWRVLHAHSDIPAWLQEAEASDEG